MRYQGGKGKLAMRIASAILARTQSRAVYLEPFVGGGAVFQRLAPAFDHSMAGDTSEDLMLMWGALREGWQPPSEVSESAYAALRHESPCPMRGLAGFGGSFGGKWFGGYARGGLNSDGTPRNHFAESARNAQRIADHMRDATLVCAPYWAWQPGAGWVIYCDPPYEGTTGYASEFDHARFWRTMRGWSERGADVFVSEYAAPDGITHVDSFTHRQSLDIASRRGVRTEHLWAA